jgi:hypothetical protein
MVGGDGHRGLLAVIPHDKLMQAAEERISDIVLLTMPLRLATGKDHGGRRAAQRCVPAHPRAGSNPQA